MSPNFLYEMDVQQARDRIEALTEKALAEWPGYFLVDLSVAPAQVKILVDADEGASIDRLASLNRSLYREIGEEGIFPAGDFSLEVSSPGLGEPLKLRRQYGRHRGRTLEVTLRDGSVLTGKLLDLTEETITLEEAPKKKAAPVQTTIAYDQIKYTKVCVVF